MVLRFLTIALATLAIFALHVLPASAQTSGAIPGGLYEAFSEDAVGCDEGDLQATGGFTLRVNAFGDRVIELVATEVTLMGSFIGTVAISADVPIAPDGTYSAPISFPPVVISGEGRFEGETVRGSFRVELNGVVECEGTFVGHSVPVPEPEGALFESPIEVIGPGCGGGSIEMLVSPDLGSLLEVRVDDFNAGGTITSGVATFPVGAVPIAQDGTFDRVYFPGLEAGQEISVSGRVSFVVVMISGVVDVFPSACGPAPFNARPTRIPGSDFGDRDEAGYEVAGLPNAGKRPASADQGWPLLLLFGLGVSSFASGLAIRTLLRR